MQEKQIPFNGITLTPYSDISPDGQLSDSENMELYNGALRPITVNGQKYSGFGRYNLIYIHTTAYYQHYIFTDNNQPNNLYYTTSLAKKDLLPLANVNSNVKNIEHIGNTLCVLTQDDGIYYILYNEATYKSLGNKIPEIPLNFWLKQKTDISLERSYYFKSGRISNENIYVTSDSNTPFGFNGEAYNLYKNKVLTQINEEIEVAKKEGLFLMPFLLRYAIKLYNGDYIYQSAPILMLPSKKGFLAITPYYQIGAYFDYFLIVSRCKLGFDNISEQIKEKLSLWKDIIKNIEIFVSNQFNLIDYDNICGNNGIHSAKEVNVWDDFGIFVSTGENLPNSYRQVQSTYYAYLNNYKNEILYTSEHIGNEVGIYCRPYGYHLPFNYINENDFNEKISNESFFYRIASYKIDKLIDLEDAQMFVEIVESSLLNLAQQKRLPDDQMSHYSLTSNGIWTYNKRLVLNNTMLNVSNPFKGYTHFAHTSGYIQVDYHFIENDFIEFNESVDYPQTGSITVDVFLNKNGKSIVTRNTPDSNDFKCSFCLPGMLYFFYPDADAYRAVIKIEYGNLIYGDCYYYDLPLKKHTFLNGAFWFDGINTTGPEKIKQPNPSYSISSADELYLKNINEIKISEVNNPFLFPLEGTNIVGTGTILALSSIVKPLSQGQYGQYPIMAFCSDGNYALQINEEGLIVAAPPMQRDVCINPNSITQIDGAVIYVAERGVMMADGNDIQCISSQLTGVTDTFTDKENGVIIRPMDLFRKCNTIFDYANQRIIFFDPTNILIYALTYSLTSGTWNNITVLDFIKAINIYPYSYIQDKNGNIILIDQSYDFQPAQQLIEGKIITRPLKLDTLQLKRLTAFALQGIFKEKQQISLYGSNDAVNWKHIGTTKRAAVNNITGRTYKYFRFIINTKLTPEENISGFRIQYDIRPEKRLR